MTQMPFSSLRVACVVLVACALVPDTAHAYVDPGIVAVLFQYVYVAVFGLLTLLFVRPVRAVKGAIKRVRSLFGGKPRN